MDPFIASEALAAGRINRYQLAADHRRLLPGVYVSKSSELKLADSIAATWLWSRRRGVISGSAASALHGARWVDRAAPIEVNIGHNRAPAGVITRRDSLHADEVTRVQGIAVTDIIRRVERAGVPRRR